MSQIHPFPNLLVTHVHLNDYLRLPRRFPQPSKPDPACYPSMVPECVPRAVGPTPAPDASEHEPVIHRS